MSNKALTIREYIRNNPGIVAKDVSVGTGLPLTEVSARLSQLFAAKFIIREPAGKTTHNSYFYKYYYNTHKVLHKEINKKLPPLKKPEPILTNITAQQVVVNPENKTPIQKSVATNNLRELLEQIASKITDNLVEIISKNLEQRLPVVLQELTSIPKELPKETMEHLFVSKPWVDSSTKENKSKTTDKISVGVVGLMPQQNGYIAQEFAEFVDLQFWGLEDNKKGLEAMSKSCAMIFVHIRHISHTVDDLLKMHGANYTRVGGGVTSIKEAIRTYLNSVIKPGK